MHSKPQSDLVGSARELVETVGSAPSNSATRAEAPRRFPSNDKRLRHAHVHALRGVVPLPKKIDGAEDETIFVAREALDLEPRRLTWCA